MKLIQERIEEAKRKVEEQKPKVVSADILAKYRANKKD